MIGPHGLIRKKNEIKYNVDADLIFQSHFKNPFLYLVAKYLWFLSGIFISIGGFIFFTYAIIDSQIQEFTLDIISCFGLGFLYFCIILVFLISFEGLDNVYHIQFKVYKTKIEIRNNSYDFIPWHFEWECIDLKNYIYFIYAHNEISIISKDFNKENYPIEQNKHNKEEVKALISSLKKIGLRRLTYHEWNMKTNK